MVASDTLLRHASSNFCPGLIGPAAVAREGNTQELFDSTENIPPPLWSVLSACVADFVGAVAEGASGNVLDEDCCARLPAHSKQQMADVTIKCCKRALCLFNKTDSPRLKLVSSLSIDGDSHRGGSDCSRLTRFCGTTWMNPLRGLSMSAMRRKDMETTSGSMKSMMPFALRAPYPTSTLQQTAMAIIKAHADDGIRFHHAAWV